MDDEDFIAAMSEGIPPIAPPEPLATLNDMHVRVKRMIEASPQRTQRTRQRIGREWNEWFQGNAGAVAV